MEASQPTSNPVFFCMNLFPILRVEPIVQVADKTRLDATKSFISPSGSFDEVYIQPSANDAPILVSTEAPFLDWVYGASGKIEATVVLVAASATASATQTIEVVTSEWDHLFSTDEDLRQHEPDILKWVVDGRSSFLDTHRRAQTLILKWLDKEGYVDIYGKPFTKEAIVDIEEVREWSTFLALKIIFEGISNAVDDIFHEKAKRYNAKMVEYRSKALLRLDVDGDGKAEEFEGITPAFGFIARR